MKSWSSYRGSRVLVTGATGLIGSHLVPALLDSGAVVHILAVPEPEPHSLLVQSGRLAELAVHPGRLEDKYRVSEVIASVKPSYVFHLGAQTLVGRAREAPADTFATNVAGTWHLLEACRSLASAPRAIVVASSDKAYGRSDRLPYVETDALAGREPYEASKAMTDILSTTYGQTYGLPTRVTRCGNVYGRGDTNMSRLIPGVVVALLRGERPQLRSDGSPIRDYVHVEDVTAGYLSVGCTDVAPGEAFNFSSGERLSVLEVVRCLADGLESSLEPVMLDSAVGELHEQYLDSSKADRVLGWRARRRLGESLPEILSWYRRTYATAITPEAATPE